MSSFGVDEAGKVVEEWDYLNRFFKRFNKVRVEALVAVSRPSPPDCLLTLAGGFFCFKPQATRPRRW